MTERLYYQDAYCTSFSSSVIERMSREGHPAVVLDRTAFYPTSGGQPADRGTLDGIEVLDVIVREEDSAIIHVLERDLTASTVQGEVEWPRRFDHMQQHTGQHVLSAAFEQLLDADTVGFHLGADLSTVDINIARLEPAAVAPVETLVNQVIWEDRPVSMRLVGPDELAALPLRRPPAVVGQVRIVDITSPAARPGPSFDVNPCGGTHVARTGEIGLIKVLRLEYRGDETRVEFLCGERALHDYQEKHVLVTRLAGSLTVGHWELDQAIARMQSESKQLRRRLKQAAKRLEQVEAAELAEAAIPQGPLRVVWRVWQHREPGELRALAQALARHTGVVALLASTGDRTHVCVSRAEGLDLDAAVLLRNACAQLGGKGGGQAHLAQGSAPAAKVSRVEAVISSLVASLPADTVAGAP